MQAIVLDMDGTITDLYGVDNWLSYLLIEDPTPYAVAKPYGDSKAINAALAALQSMGYIVEVVSWLSKGDPSKGFNNAVRNAKLEWLSKYYPSIDPSNVHVVAHGTSKWHVSKYKGGILFDDEQGNVDCWNRNSNSGYAIKIDNTNDLLSTLLDLLEKTF